MEWRFRFGRFRFGGAWLGMAVMECYGEAGHGKLWRSWYGLVRFVMVGRGVAVTERRGRRGQVWHGPLRRSRLGLVVRGEEWQGGRGLERLVTVRLGEFRLGG